MKKVMSLKTRELLINGIVGVMWISYGIIQILKVNKTINLITTVVCLIALLVSAIPYFVKTEIRDEMARHNMDKARGAVCELFFWG